MHNNRCSFSGVQKLNISEQILIVLLILTILTLYQNHSEKVFFSCGEIRQSLWG